MSCANRLLAVTLKISGPFSELLALRTNVECNVVIRDLNCRNAQWLKYSNGMSTEDATLKRFKKNHGLQQIVREPTVGNYLLDLIRTDMHDVASARILAAMADHSVVLTRFRCSVETFSWPPRHVYWSRSANWPGLKNDLN